MSSSHGPSCRVRTVCRHIGSNHTLSTLSRIGTESARVSPTQLTLISPPKTMRTTNGRQTDVAYVAFAGHAFDICSMCGCTIASTRQVFVSVCSTSVACSMNECGHHSTATTRVCAIIVALAGKRRLAIVVAATACVVLRRAKEAVLVEHVRACTVSMSVMSARTSVLIRN